MRHDEIYPPPWQSRARQVGVVYHAGVAETGACPTLFGAPEFFLMAVGASLGVIALNYFAWKKAEQTFKWNGTALLALFILGVFLSLEDKLAH